MKIHNFKRFILSTVVILVCSGVSVGEENLKLDLPIGLERLIQDAIDAKKKAMEYPGMHHNEWIAAGGVRVGISGKLFEQLMNQISNFSLNDELIQSAERCQHTDIRAKIITFALDRRDRREEYERFEKYYVNRPKDDEAFEYFSRPLASENPDPFAGPRAPDSLIPRPGTWTPNPVGEEDQKEEFRLILEYFYFAPRIREAFDNDLVRSHLSQSLINLGNVDRSLVVWQSDLSIALQVPVETLERNRGAGWNVYVSVWPLVRMETKEAYQVLAGHWGNKQAREAIEWQLRQSWWPLKPQPLDMSRYEEASKRHGAWMTLARETWETPNEKSFAAWLLAQPAPPVPDR